MSLANPFPWWAVIPLAAALGWFAWQAYARVGDQLGPARRSVLVSLRAITLACLALLLMRPVLIEPDPDRTDRIVAILIDTSRSMGIADASGRSRLEQARAEVGRSLLPAIGDGFHPEVLSFAQRLGQAGDAPDPEARGPRTDLGGALRELRERYRGQRLAAVVVVSDGADTGPGDAIATARDLGIPVFTVGAKGGDRAGDREVLAVSAGDRGPADALVRLRATVVDHGSDGKPFDVRVLENGVLSQVRTVTSGESGTSRTVEFLVAPPKDGGTVYTVQAPVAPGEIVEANNQVSVLVKPSGRRRRVLLLQGTPGYDHGFLTRALFHDPSIELDTVVRKGLNDRGDATYYIQGDPSRTAALSEGFPSTKEALFAYDALILANLRVAALPEEQVDTLARFVDARGGGLAVIGSRALDDDGLGATPLGPVLPVDLTDPGRDVVPTTLGTDTPNHVLVTDEGYRHPIMQLGPSREESVERWALMPALAATTMTGRPRAGATVLARTLVPGGGPSPLIVVQRYGNGRSMVFAGDGAWRWRMMRPAADRSYETFWRQAARWLAEGTPDAVSAVVPQDVVAGDEVPVTVTVRDGAFAAVPNADVSVDVTAPDGQRESLPAGVAEPSAGRYVARFNARSEGIHRIRVRVSVAGRPLPTREEWALVGGADPEFVEPWPNENLLRRVADASGGRFLATDELGTLPGLLAAKAPDGAPPVVRELWHGPWTFLALVALLGMEWALRRAWGLR